MFLFALQSGRDLSSGTGRRKIDEESFPALEECLDGGWRINPTTQFSIQFGRGSPSDLGLFSSLLAGRTGYWAGVVFTGIDIDFSHSGAGYSRVLQRWLCALVDRLAGHNWRSSGSKDIYIYIYRERERERGDCYC